VIDTTDAAFERDVLGAEVPVVVEFTAPWCRPCRAVDRHLHELEEAYAGSLAVARLDVDANVGVPSRYGVLSLPTVIVFAGGEPRETIHGAQPRRRYEEAAARAVAGSTP
jgi:thioredoxin 1